MIVDGDMSHLPAGASAGIAAVAGNAVAGPLDAAELLGIQVQHLARSAALVADDRLDRLQNL
jgi:hypothetical protein